MNHPILQHLPAVALSFALLGSTSSAQAQDTPAPAPNYITQTITAITIPEGGSRKEFHALYEEYFDKVIAKSKLVKHFTIYQHAWGSNGGSFVITLEYGSWNDIEQFTQVEREALAKAGWPDEAARKAFFAKFMSYQDMHHHDEIYTVIPDLRR